MEKFELEYSFNTSLKLLYPRLSSPGGLAEWFADDVNMVKDEFVFSWKSSESKAKILHKKNMEYIRYQWSDNSCTPPYFEFRLEKTELTGDISLIVTDFAPKEEKAEAIDLWNEQVGRLKHILGA